jgi:hypothetical protein
MNKTSPTETTKLTTKLHYPSQNPVNTKFEKQQRQKSPTKTSLWDILSSGFVTNKLDLK